MHILYLSTELFESPQKIFSIADAYQVKVGTPYVRLQNSDLLILLIAYCTTLNPGKFRVISTEISPKRRFPESRSWVSFNTSDSKHKLRRGLARARGKKADELWIIVRVFTGREKKDVERVAPS